MQLDGNVTRLLSRLTAIYASPKIKSTLDVLWAGAAKMVESTDKPGDTNQALIELGSTVCKVREPLCEDCPMQPWCGAYALTNATSVPADSSGNEIPDIEDMCTLCEPLPIPSPVTAFPMKVERKKAREELDIVNVVEWRRNDDPAKRWFLLVRRPEGGKSVLRRGSTFNADSSLCGYGQAFWRAYTNFQHPPMYYPHRPHQMQIVHTHCSLTSLPHRPPRTRNHTHLGPPPDPRHSSALRALNQRATLYTFFRTSGRHTVSSG